MVRGDCCGVVAGGLRFCCVGDVCVTVMCVVGKSVNDRMVRGSWRVGKEDK